ncbi:two-component system sensor histidine kinase ResE [Paenibacillus turicensis]|uniref:histidine kinase n=1 Tax=Paenibacillus turicensis TaxID=160487 RepID=A0ABS4FY61_9BACL|nr:two-component system sensor histidine kinase ResE [Paenibacillus turicensis]
MNFWRTLVGKLWITIIGLVACVMLSLGLFLLPYIDTNFTNPEAIKKLFVIVAIIGFSLTTFFALFLFTKITQPMQQLIAATDSVRKGNYDTRLSLRTSDEIGELANTFNHMAEELENTIQSLNHEKEHLASILKSMTDAVITLDRTGNIILTNPPGEDVLAMWGQLIDSPIPQPLQDMFEKLLQQGNDQSEHVYVKQGTWSVHMAPLFSNNELRGAVAVLRDVTEEVNLEKMRRDFVANVSHEIRTPLSMMQGYSEALIDGMATSPEESQELIQVIHDESLRMGRLVHDLLDLARMEAGHTEMVMAQVDLHELLERVYRKFLVRAKEAGLDLHLALASDDLILSKANEDRLEQVFTNLLDNAYRHSGDHTVVTIGAENIVRNQQPMIHAFIADQGMGIPPKDVPYIFERFYKADKARVRGVAGGTGLGLSIVKNIVDAHEGEITVESELNEGTVFHLFFPVESKG